MIAEADKGSMIGSTTDTGAIERYLEKLEHVQCVVAGTMDLPLHTYVVFLSAAIADRSGVPMDGRQLAEACGLAASTISRNLGMLGEWDYKQKRGLGLVTLRAELENRRRKPVRLTAKGQRALSQLLKERA